MNFPIIMSLWLMRQGLDDDTDTDMTNASALESAAFALCCIGRGRDFVCCIGLRVGFAFRLLLFSE